MGIFTTTDHHFHHKNIIEHCGRPFKTVEEMDRAMMEKREERGAEIEYDEIEDGEE